MGEESPKPPNKPTGAVFLSYASQDAEAAEKICNALRAVGIEVWFDQSELRGGDAWDQSIRKQIKTCALFIPIISKNTHERAEGYFRLEWKLAVDRSHLIMANKAFLVPVVIDDTGDDDENVPEKFREVQWTRLPNGETSPAFIARIQKLLVPDAPTRATTPTPSGSTIARASKPSVHPTRASNIVLWVVSVLLAIGLGYLVAERLWRPQHSQATPASQKTASSASATSSTADTFNPPPRSIAVLPFVNLSGDKEQEYFSDGLTEELLNSLAAIDGLQVAARTSSFSFREHPDVVSVAHKLNVGAVLEGSVRRSGHTVRITAQLINAVTGFHLWSKTYDRDLDNLLTLQTEIATSVANALKVTLLSDVAAKIELGGTRNPAAFDAYLRATKAYSKASEEKGYQEAITAYTEAINLDPAYALAYAGRAAALLGYSEEAPPSDTLDRARSDALRAIALAPDLADGHLALSGFYASSLDIAHANDEIRRAVALAPGRAHVLRVYGRFVESLGHGDEGISAIRRALLLDPLNVNAHLDLAYVLNRSRRYNEAVTASRDAMTLDPDNMVAHTLGGYAYYFAGDFEDARALCEAKRDYWRGQICLALVYEKLGRHTDAESMLAKVRSRFGDSGAYGYTYVYAQWGNIPEALKWLDTAYRLRDNDLLAIKTDPAFDPLRKEPRYQAIEKALKFPE
jgi:TolB-like protein/tetratricopeptide (TPR) repeat protein